MPKAVMQPLPIVPSAERESMTAFAPAYPEVGEEQPQSDEPHRDEQEGLDGLLHTRRT